MTYELLAIDLDGTLLDGSKSVPFRNIHAVRRAVDAGLPVAVCTGRGYVEARAILDQVGLTGPHVFNTGAMVVEHPTAATLDRSLIDPTWVRWLVERFADAPYAVLLYRDRDACGHDCLVTGAGRVTDSSLWWFDHIGARIQRVAGLTDADCLHTVRVGMVGDHGLMVSLSESLKREHGDRFETHAFEAVLEKETGALLSILEVFSAGVNKWTGIQSVCARLGADPGKVAFIGDQINDLPALTNAALGIAVGNAVDSAKAAADVVLTQTNKEGAVAVAIQELIGVGV